MSVRQIPRPDVGGCGWDMLPSVRSGAHCFSCEICLLLALVTLPCPIPVPCPSVLYFLSLLPYQRQEDIKSKEIAFGWSLLKLNI